MENQVPEREDALQFARVWKRVMPEGGPIIPAFAAQPEEPAPEAQGREDRLIPFFKEQIAGEQRLCRDARQLWRRTGCGEFAACAGGAGKRARKLAAGLYLLSGKWLLPAVDRLPGGNGSQPSLRTLHRALQALELRYLAQAAGMEDGEDAALLQENAQRCHKDAVLLSRLLEQRGPV